MELEISVEDLLNKRRMVHRVQNSLQMKSGG